MTFDKQLFALFAQWPDAAYVLCGDTPPAGLRFSAPVLKAIERRLDGLFEPADPAAPRRIMEVQFQRRDDIYPCTGSYLGLVHQLDVRRPVEAVILFARRDLDPQTPPWNGFIRAVYLDEALAEIGHRDPRHSFLGTFAPVFEDDQERLAAEARKWYDSIRESELAAPAQEACVTIFLSWLAERFTHLTAKEFAMILDLPPLTKSRAVQELIANGHSKGLREGKREGHQAMLLKLAAHKFGALPLALGKRVRTLDSVELEFLGVALLDMKSAKELRTWLERHSMP